MPEISHRAPKNVYFEEVVIGDEFVSAEHTVTQPDIATFAEISRDRHPLHTDLEYCKTTAFGRPIAHGLYTLALMGGLKAELELYRDTSVASLGWDKVRFLKPVIAGDTVHVKVRFVGKRDTSRPDRGVVTQLVTMVNQAGEVVAEGEHQALLRRKASRAAAG